MRPECGSDKDNQREGEGHKSRVTILKLEEIEEEGRTIRATVRCSGAGCRHKEGEEVAEKIRSTREKGESVGREKKKKRKKS